IEREKDVVAQEIAEAFDTPDDQVFEMAQTKAFAGQSMGRPILGSIASLKPVTRETIGDWRARLYSPDRMVVSVSGAVDEAELLALAQRWFGDAVARAADAPELANFVGGAATLSRKIEQANLVFQLPALSATDPDLPAMRLFTEILGGGMASRLFQSAREERGLAYAIDAYHETYEDTGVLGIYAGAAADRAVELAQVCADEIRSLATDGPIVAELSRAKAVQTAGLWMSDESPASRAGRNAAQTLIYGAPVSSDASVAKITAVTADDLKRVGMRVLASGKAATAVLGPKGANGAGAAFVKGLAG
ncbi:M16 family metallopeptidase, partial [Brevundimonas sp.]|uniref:M16 family metallopeptidase n=1 Tax=Brevundimonas sp. TaxID=1871086 RepID=UPI003783C714